MYKYIVIELLGWFFIAGTLAWTLIKLGAWAKLRKKYSVKRRLYITSLAFVLISFLLIFYGRNNYSLHFAMPPTMHAMTSDENPPSLPL